MPARGGLILEVWKLIGIPLIVEEHRAHLSSSTTAQQWKELEEGNFGFLLRHTTTTELRGLLGLGKVNLLLVFDWWKGSLAIGSEDLNFKLALSGIESRESKVG